MFLTLDSKRRLTLPKDLVTAEPGDYFDAMYDAEDDAVIFRKVPSKEDWLSVLAMATACPCPHCVVRFTQNARERPACRHGHATSACRACC